MLSAAGPNKRGAKTLEDRYLHASFRMVKYQIAEGTTTHTVSHGEFVFFVFVFDDL